MEFMLEGRVVHGKKYGRKIGYPTANIDGRAYPKLRKKIRTGVYAGFATLEKTKKAYKAGIIVQPRKDHDRPQIEAYLISFKGNLYGKKLKLEFKKFIRPYRNFKGREKLIPQIKRDLKKILSHL
jgi:riboflavin kinase/FMN adenylyltransferase